MYSTLSFGVAGIPLSTEKPGYLTGLQKTMELGLRAFEIPFGHFINMSEETAHQFFQKKELLQKEYGEVLISVHAPYFINLNANDPVKKAASIDRILKAAMRGAIAGATSIVFHPGFYLKDTPEVAYGHMSESIAELLRQYRDISATMPFVPILRPETTGKVAQFGSIAELIALSNTFSGKTSDMPLPHNADQILPCIDFAHLHAKSNGAINTYEEIDVILIELQKELGDRIIKNMHIHYSGIEYTPKGEKKHLPLRESDANYKDVMKALKAHNVCGRLICESPEMEKDALLLHDAYSNS